MKITYITIICLFSSFLISNADEAKQDLITSLREKIKRHELILLDLNTKLLALEDQPKDECQITITSKALLIDEKTITQAELKDRLKVLPKNTKIKIFSDASIEYKKVVSLIETVSKIGFHNISFNTFTKEREAKNSSSENQ